MYSGQSSVFRQCGQGCAGFFQQQAGFGFLLLEAFDHLGRRFGEEAFVAQLALRGGQAFFVFGDVFGEALALGGDVDGALVDHGNVEFEGRMF